MIQKLLGWLMIEGLIELFNNSNNSFEKELRADIEAELNKNTTSENPHDTGQNEHTNEDLS